MAAAWLGTQPESEIVRNALDEIHCVLRALRSVVDDRVTPSQVERDQWQRRWNAAAGQLMDVARAAEIPLWIFSEFRTGLIETLIARIGSDQEVVALELDALLEALNGCLKHQRVEVVRAEPAVEFEGIQLLVASTAAAALRTPGQLT